MPKTMQIINFKQNKKDLTIAAEILKEFLMSTISNLFGYRSCILFSNKSELLANMFVNTEPSALTVGDTFDELYLSHFQAIDLEEYFTNLKNYLSVFLQTGYLGDIDHIDQTTEIPEWHFFYKLPITTYFELISILTNDYSIFDIDEHIENFIKYFNAEYVFSDKTTIEELFLNIKKSISEHSTTEFLSNDAIEIEHAENICNMGLNIFETVFLRPYNMIYGSNRINTINQFIANNNSNTIK